jgi:hypothetical protein
MSATYFAHSNTNKFWPRVQMIKLHIMQVSPPFTRLLSLVPNFCLLFWYFHNGKTIAGPGTLELLPTCSTAPLNTVSDFVTFAEVF